MRIYGLGARAAGVLLPALVLVAVTVILGIQGLSTPGLTGQLTGTDVPETCGMGPVACTEIGDCSAVTCGGTGGATCHVTGYCDCDACGACGNSVINPGEQCDDGNLTNGDGCSAACAWEQQCNTTCSPETGCACGGWACVESFPGQWGCTLGATSSAQAVQSSAGATVVSSQTGAASSANGASSAQAASSAAPASSDPGSASSIAGASSAQAPSSALAASSTAGVSSVTGASSTPAVSSSAFLDAICGNGRVDAGEQCDPPAPPTWIINDCRHPLESIGYTQGCIGANQCECYAFAAAVNSQCGGPGSTTFSPLRCLVLCKDAWSGPLPPTNMTAAACQSQGGTCADPSSPTCVCYKDLCPAPPPAVCGAGKACSGCRCVASAGTCGNGVREGSEGCDDGNVAGGDGCSPSCAVEPGFQCTPPGTGGGTCPAGRTCSAALGTDGICRTLGPQCAGGTQLTFAGKCGVPSCEGRCFACSPDTP